VLMSIHKHIVASATDTVTNTTSETAFSKTITLPAQSLRAGDLARGFACVKATSTNSTDTLTCKVYLGPASDPTTGFLLCDQTAIDVANSDVVMLDFKFCVDAIGAGSTFKISGGGISYKQGATAVSKTQAFSAAVDAQASSYADLVLAVTATWSAASTSDIARLDALHLEIEPGLISA